MDVVGGGEQRVRGQLPPQQGQRLRRRHGRAVTLPLAVFPAEEVQDLGLLLRRQPVDRHGGELLGLGLIQQPHGDLVPLGVSAVQTLAGGEDIPVVVLRHSLALLRGIGVEGVQHRHGQIEVVAAGGGQGRPVHVQQQRQPPGDGISPLDRGHDLHSVVVELGIAVVAGTEGGEHIVTAVPEEEPVVALVVQHGGEILVQDLPGLIDVAVIAVLLRLLRRHEKDLQRLLAGINAAAPLGRLDEQSLRRLLEELVAGEEPVGQLRAEQRQQVVPQLRQRIKSLHAEVGRLVRLQELLRGGKRAEIEPVPGGPGLLIQGQRLLLGDARSDLGRQLGRAAVPGMAAGLPAPAEGQR